SGPTPSLPKADPWVVTIEVGVTSRLPVRPRCVNAAALRQTGRRSVPVQPGRGSRPTGEDVRGRPHGQGEHVLRPGNLHGDVLTVAGDLDVALRQDAGDLELLEQVDVDLQRFGQPGDRQLLGAIAADRGGEVDHLGVLRGFTADDVESGDRV